MAFKKVDYVEMLLAESGQRASVPILDGFQMKSGYYLIRYGSATSPETVGPVKVTVHELRTQSPFRDHTPLYMPGVMIDDDKNTFKAYDLDDTYFERV